MKKVRPVIRLSKSCIDEAEKEAVLNVLDREFLGMGDVVKNFEDDLSTFFGRRAVCVVNGTAALQLALEACDIGVGSEVLVPSITYVASFQAISATGAKAIACDLDPKTGFIDLDDAKIKVNDNTRAIMPVHFNGGVGEIGELYKFSKENELRVIEDAAHAFGTVYESKKIGSIGDIVCFSFDGIKNITSGEGGCVVSADEKVLERIRDSRLLGVEKDTDKRFSGQRSWQFDVKRQGWRYHMSNIMAAIGIEQLKKARYFFSKRQDLAKLYDHLLKDEPRINILKRDYDNVVPHIYVIMIKNLKNRDVLMQKLLDFGIQTGIHYPPNHLLSFYKDESSSKIQSAEVMYDSMLTLPLHPDLTNEDVKLVSKTLIKLINDSSNEY